MRWKRLTYSNSARSTTTVLGPNSGTLPSSVAPLSPTSTRSISASSRARFFWVCCSWLQRILRLVARAAVGLPLITGGWAKAARSLAGLPPYFGGGRPRRLGGSDSDGGGGLTLRLGK